MSDSNRPFDHSEQNPEDGRPVMTPHYVRGQGVPTRLRMRAFTVTAKGEVCGHYEAVGLTLDDVLARELSGVEHDDGSFSPWDLTVWESNRVVAVIHRSGQKTATVTRIGADQDEASPAPAPDQAEGGGEPAAPPHQGRRMGEPHHRRRPFFRQTMTLAPPWDCDAGTVEIIALADGLRDEDESANEDDVPELREAGWHCLSGTPLSLFARFIV